MVTVRRATVVKGARPAATLERTRDGVEFAYRPEYLADPGSRPVATTLPLSDAAVRTASGAVPPFFAGLLPEGRRLSTLRRRVKTSADDEFGLLLAIGGDTIGDVRVVDDGAVDDRAAEDPATEASDLSGLTVDRDFSEISFADALAEGSLVALPALAGVQEKASARVISLPVRRRGERYILKLDPPEYPHLVENEEFFLDLARSARLPTVDARIVRDRDGIPGLLVTRFDRMPRADAPLPLAVEDAAQALGIWPADKYDVSFEEAAVALLAHTPGRAIAARDLLRQLAFAWLTGNGDQHAKNLSIMQTPDGEWRLAPAYDLPSTFPYGDDTMALRVEGRDVLTRAGFAALGSRLGLPERAVARSARWAVDATEGLGDRIEAGALPFPARTNAKLARVVRRRRDEFS
ncbi:type II toxin-antitoxin system HipA family toxin [Agromyces sp. MMS24-JH15]|uniref:type II toxin-antitoxin system HipA family toxin n=1 Tax=Agromyces sp. MMS24-JH15 TaxID=3243765 RepID=UPI003748D2F8